MNKNFFPNGMLLNLKMTMKENFFLSKHWNPLALYFVLPIQCYSIFLTCTFNLTNWDIWTNDDDDDQNDTFFGKG